MFIRITFIDGNHRNRPVARRPRRGSDLPPRDRSSGPCIRVGAMLLVISFTHMLFCVLIIHILSQNSSSNPFASRKMRSRSRHVRRDPNGAVGKTIALSTASLDHTYKLGTDVDRTPLFTGCLAFKRGPLGGSIVRSTGPMYRVSASRVSLAAYWLYKNTIHGTIATGGLFTRARPPGTIDRNQEAGPAGRRRRSRSPGHDRGMDVRIRGYTRNSDLLRGGVELRPLASRNRGHRRSCGLRTILEVLLARMVLSCIFGGIGRV